MSSTFLLDAMACVLWPVWGAFVLDVARSTTDQVRAGPRPSLPHTGPLNTLATLLVATVLMTVVSRPPSPVSATPALAVTATTTTTTSVSTPQPTGHVGFTQAGTATTQTSHISRTTDTVEVKLPHDGIYDSLWRIADRTLGDGSRWPEIYALNHGRPQADGHTLVQPSFIRPGWIFRLPADRLGSGTNHSGHHTPVPSTPAAPHSPQTSTPAKPNGSPSPSTSRATPTPSPQSTPTAPSASHNPSQPSPVDHAYHQPGIRLPTGAFVGVGLAALISAALLMVRRRRRVHYRVGSGDRGDLTIAPVVRALRLAHDNATRTDDREGLELLTQQRAPVAEAARASGEDLETGALTPPPADRRIIGVKDGQALAWDLARARGLGLIGPGAPNAIHALLISLLAERIREPTTGRVEILIPAADARTLIGENISHPAGLRIVDDLDAALDTMEAELLTRASTDVAARNSDSPPAGDLVLVAAPAPHAARRLQAVLDNGSPLGLAGILFGQWRPGATARIRSDGTVATTDSSTADALSDARLFTLPTTDTQALLDLLYDAQPAQHPRAQSPRATPPTLAPASGQRNPGTETPASRPTPARPGRRPAHGPAPRLDAQEPHAADGGRHQDAADTGPDDKATLTPQDDDPRSASADPQALPVLDPNHTTHVAAGESDPGVPFANNNPRGPHTAAPVNSTAASPSQSAGADEFLSVHRPLQLILLGRLRLGHQQTGGDEYVDLSPALTPKQREILAYLALHRGGVRREALATALWPDAPRDRPFNSFHATMSQLRRALRTATDGTLRDVTVHEDGHYGLDQDQITVDLWQLQDALETSRRDARGQCHRTTLERVVALYSGDLAAHLTAEWIEAPREALRRDVLDTVSALVRIVRDDEPEQAVALLERARRMDRYNEAIYRDIARLQAHLGQQDAVPRTLALLATTLAEIDEEPSQETVALCESLQRSWPTKRTPNSTPPR
ncbi:hypothetical protein ACIPX0_49845 [Streptomyces sp. NPDC090075]|uniref:hypothetical protein n=1 Tax=Streptomyces sp. NPDC090075 TaxID=3365937 RepID=UPI0037F49366